MDELKARAQCRIGAIARSARPCGDGSRKGGGALRHGPWVDLSARQKKANAQRPTPNAECQNRNSAFDIGRWTFGVGRLLCSQKHFAPPRVFDSVSNMASQTQLTWYGHAAFKLITPADNVLLIDPWLTNPV